MCVTCNKTQLSPFHRNRNQHPCTSDTGATRPGDYRAICRDFYIPFPRKYRTEYIVRFLAIFVRFAYNEDAEEHTIHHEGGAYYDRNRNRVQD